MLSAEQIWRGHRSFSPEPIVNCDESGWAVVNSLGQEMTARYPKKHLALTEYSAFNNQQTIEAIHSVVNVD